MIDRNYIGGKKVSLSTKRNIELKYFVFFKRKLYADTNEDLMAYGIEIESFNNEIYETARVEDITTDFEKITNIANLLKDNDVMPIHLRDIIEDLI